MMLSHAVPFSVLVLPVAGDPVQWPLGKIREQRWHRRVKEMLVLALGLGGSLLSSGLAMGCPTQPGQQLSCPGGLLCCVF